MKHNHLILMFKQIELLLLIHQTKQIDINLNLQIKH